MAQGKLISHQTLIKFLEWYLNNPEQPEPTNIQQLHIKNAMYSKKNITFAKMTLNKAWHNPKMIAFRSSSNDYDTLDNLPAMLNNDGISVTDYLNMLKQQQLVQPAKIKTFIKKNNRHTLALVKKLNKKLERQILEYVPKVERKIKQQNLPVIKKLKNLRYHAMYKSWWSLVHTKKTKQKMVKRLTEQIRANQRKMSKQLKGNTITNWKRIFLDRGKYIEDYYHVYVLTPYNQILGTAIHIQKAPYLPLKNCKKIFSEPCFKSDLNIGHVFDDNHNYYCYRKSSQQMPYITKPSSMIDYYNFAEPALIREKYRID